MVATKRDDDKERQRQQYDESLATLLSDLGHEELFIETIQNVASSMRNDIENLFTASNSIKNDEHDHIETRLDDSVTGTSMENSNEPMMLDAWSNDRNMTSKQEHETTKQQAKAQKQIVKRKEKKQVSETKKREKDEAAIEKEVSSDEFCELRNKSLQHFDTWSTQALGRITGELRLEMQEQESLEDQPGKAKSLIDLPEPHRVLILHSCLLLLLGLEHYPSESRIFLKRLLSHLDLAGNVLVREESKVAQGLAHAASSEMNADEETKQRIRKKKVARRWMIGAGAAVGATLIGVTGGLAAPLLAAGVGGAMAGIGLGSTAVATYLGALAGSAPLIGVLFGAYGGRMAG